MKFKTILLLFALCVAVGANAQTSEDVVDRVSRAVGVRLPDGYEAKVKEFVAKSKVLEGTAEDFTELWIAGQMKTSWGIDRGNQLLFVWDAIYEQITKKNFYDGEDGNKKRLDEFEKVMDNVEACGKKYKEDFTAHMKQRSAEAQQRSAEAQQRSAESRGEAMRLDSIGLKEIAWIYTKYKDKPGLIKAEEIQYATSVTKTIIKNCKLNNIDYKAVLRKELGDDKKVEELLKFYGVE